VWNSWKRQLLAELFEATEELLRLGHKQRGRQERVDAVRADLGKRLKWNQQRVADFAARFPDSYWLAEPIEVIEKNARLVEEVDKDGAKPLWIGVQKERGATLLTVYTEDQPGLFYRLAGAISLVGGNIIDARVHTSSDAMALDNFLIQDAAGLPFAEKHQLKRLEESVTAAAAGKEPSLERLEAKALPLTRAEAFPIQPAVFIDNEASNRTTVVEVNARDRAALLSSLAHSVYESGATIHSAHIATYGERAVDVFYLTDFEGEKITAPARLKALHDRLLKAAGETRALKAA
jgi:[protein-PII] uridylyltransferase